jgi:hypothetical protein
MFLEGTRIAVGIPDTYDPDNFRQRSRNGMEAQGVLASAFVSDFAAQIRATRIATSSRAGTADPGALNYPTEGSFKSSDLRCTAQLTQISFNTSILPAKMRRTFSRGCPSPGNTTLSCEAWRLCKKMRSPLVIQWVDENSFRYFDNLFHRNI